MKLFNKNCRFLIKCQILSKFDIQKLILKNCDLMLNFFKNFSLNN